MKVVEETTVVCTVAIVSECVGREVVEVIVEEMVVDVVTLGDVM